MTGFRHLLVSAALLLGLAAGILAPGHAADTLSEAEVRAFMRQGDQLIMQHNIGKVAGAMAADIRIRLDSETLTRSQYVNKLKQQYAALPKDFKTHYRTQVDSIQLASPKATVKSTIYQRVSAGGQSASSVHQEVVTLEKRAGMILITGLTASRPQVHK